MNNHRNGKENNYRKKNDKHFMIWNSTSNDTYQKLLTNISVKKIY